MKAFLALALTAALFAASSSLAGDLKKTATADCSNMKKYPDISKDELATLIDKKAVTVIDVNSDESYAKNHIPTAVHYAANEETFPSVLPEKKDALIVAYCGGVKCTAWQAAAQKACELGYTNVKHFKQGISGWVKKG